MPPAGETRRGERLRPALWGWVAACGLVILLSGCTLREGVPVGFGEMSRIRHGESVARKVCAACHAIPPGQVSPRPDAPEFTKIAQRYSPRGLGRELEAIGEVGHYGMPVLRLTREDRDNLVAYMASLKAPATR